MSEGIRCVEYVRDISSVVKKKKKKKKISETYINYNIIFGVVANLLYTMPQFFHMRVQMPHTTQALLS